MKQRESAMFESVVLLSKKTQNMTEAGCLPLLELTEFLQQTSSRPEIVILLYWQDGFKENRVYRLQQTSNTLLTINLLSFCLGTFLFTSFYSFSYTTHIVFDRTKCKT